MSSSLLVKKEVRGPVAIISQKIYADRATIRKTTRAIFSLDFFERFFFKIDISYILYNKTCYRKISMLKLKYA